MRFDDALAEMRKGKRVKRKVWTDSYMFIGKEIDEMIVDTTKDDGDPDIRIAPFRETLYLGIIGSVKVYPIRNIATGCVLGDDWEVVED